MYFLFCKWSFATFQLDCLIFLFFIIIIILLRCSDYSIKSLVFLFLEFAVYENRADLRNSLTSVLKFVSYHSHDSFPTYVCVPNEDSKVCEFSVYISESFLYLCRDSDCFLLALNIMPVAPRSHRYLSQSGVFVNCSRRWCLFTA